jgi:phage shock protein C
MPENQTGKRRFYRSKSERMFSGVCGGIGDYLNIDSNLVRLLFVILTFTGGIGVVLYIAALILVPENPEQEFQKTKKYNNAFVFGILLVVIGVFLLFKELEIFHDFRFFNISFSMLWGLLLVVLGAFLLLSSKKSSKTSENSDTSQQSFGNKKLYRSKSDRMISGVCSGIAKYFDIDPSIVRLLWVLATFISVGIGLVIYILFIIIIPEESSNISDEVSE